MHKALHFNIKQESLIGEEKLDGSVKYDADGNTNTFPEGFNGSVSRPKNLYTFSLFNPSKADSPLKESGLLGPVTIQVENFTTNNLSN
jgi:hypothetical protein